MLGNTTVQASVPTSGANTCFFFYFYFLAISFVVFPIKILMLDSDDRKAFPSYLCSDFADHFERPFRKSTVLFPKFF